MKTVKIDKDFLAGTDFAQYLAWVLRAELIEKHHNKDRYYTIEAAARDSDTIVLDPKDTNLVNGWTIRYKGCIKVNSKGSLQKMFFRHYRSYLNNNELSSKQNKQLEKEHSILFCGENKDWARGYFNKVLNLPLIEDPKMKKNEILFLREGTPRYLFVVA